MSQTNNEIQLAPSLAYLSPVDPCSQLSPPLYNMMNLCISCLFEDVVGVSYRFKFLHSRNIMGLYATSLRIRQP